MSVYLGDPKPAPFAVGTKVKFLGNRTGSKHGPIRDGVTYWLEAGMVCEVVDVNPGWKGTGVHDETDDGYSVVKWPLPIAYQSCICPGDEDLWEVTE